MVTVKNRYLIMGAICSAIAAIAHLGCIVFGGEWYRFFGAGEQMALLAEEGHWYPTAVTSVIVVILCLWSLYALSGAQVIMRLPFLRLGLVVITVIYLMRGLGFIFLMPHFPENGLTFWLVSSGICLFLGVMYLIGTFQKWSELSIHRDQS